MPAIWCLIILFCLQLQAGDQQIQRITDLQIIYKEDTPERATEKKRHNTGIIDALVESSRDTSRTTKALQKAAIHCYTQPEKCKTACRCIATSCYAASVIYYLPSCALFKLSLCAAWPAYSGSAGVSFCKLATCAVVGAYTLDKTEKLYDDDTRNIDHPLLRLLCLPSTALPSQPATPVARSISIPESTES